MEIQKIAAFATHSDGEVSGGNPAGVVLVNSFPSDKEMKSIAAEVGYSETVFAMALPHQNNAYRVRYFSPEGEVPFCGHATIALGAALSANESFHQNPELTFHLTLNHTQVSLHVDASEAHRLITLVSPETSHQIIDRTIDSDLTELLFDTLRDFDISPVELDWQDFPPAIVNGGSQHLALTLNNQASLENMSYDFESIKARMIKHGIVTIILAKPGMNEKGITEIDVRNAFASGGVVEDPATGAAAAAYTGYIRDAKKLEVLGIKPLEKHSECDKNKKSEYQLTFLQGRHIGMPSVIYASFDETLGSPITLTGYTRLLD